MIRLAPSARRPLPPARTVGFTLAESVVALVLLACGAAALATASAGAVRAVAAAEAQERAAIAARNRVEGLAAGGCSGLQSGSSVDSSLGLRERWTVAPARDGIRLLTDTVEQIGATIHRPIVLQRVVLC